MLFNYDRCRKYATTNSVDNITLPSPHSPSRCITRFLYKFCFHEKITANLIDVLSLAKSMCSYKVANSTLIICIKVMVLLHLILKLFSLHYTYVSACMYVCMYVCIKIGKAVPLQSWSGPEDSRNLSFPNFMTTAQEGGKVVSLTHRPHLPAGNPPGTHFC